MKANPDFAAKPKVKSPTRKKSSEYYILKLYIAGHSAKSSNTIANIKKICEENLKGFYELDVIDLYQQPQLARGEQIVAVPTLIKKLPPPLRRVIGDLSNTDRVLVGLDIKKKS
ncbi:MAG: circadian clock protein KaiB [Spirochaetae bacterium HGW-Spirochaetae-1]|jgi:circadian clock protein KaiB|nr:MAG: circadian clock protein KaiB [Spirochaetae bacterium HGW-Spirochaetae-1]